MWRPAEGPRPPRLAAWPNLLYAAYDRLGLFARRECGVLTILHGETLAHRSLVTPRTHRFPFMAADDLQIGNTWTDPAQRGRGLAAAAVALIHERWAGRFARMWYVCEADNVASIRVIERCGYRLAGRGVRTRPLGIGLLGAFRVTEQL